MPVLPPYVGRGRGRGGGGRGASRGPAARPDCTAAATAHLVWFSSSGGPEILLSGSSNPSEASSSADMAAALTPLVLQRHGSRGCGTRGRHSPGARRLCSPRAPPPGRTTGLREVLIKMKLCCHADRICFGQNVNMDSGNHCTDAELTDFYNCTVVIYENVLVLGNTHSRSHKQWGILPATYCQMAQRQSVCAPVSVCVQAHTLWRGDTRVKHLSQC